MRCIYCTAQLASCPRAARTLTRGSLAAALASMDDKEDYYKMLGLQNLRFRATQTDIKKAYRQCVLKYHPDPMAQNADASIDDEEISGLSDEKKAEVSQIIT